MIKKISILSFILVLVTSGFITGAQVNPDSTFIISAPKDVADLALRGGDFSSWNYGREIFLEAGYFIGLYDVHHGASLIRFNVSGLQAEKVISARLRLYKPKSMSQQGSVEIRIFKVSKKNGNWVEGGSVSTEESASSCWQFKANGHSWAGEPGCSKPGVDYDLPAVALSQTVASATSGWLEFDLSKELIQSWLDNPSDNTGLYISCQDNPKLAEEAHFFSSEHPSGKGPQLIINATKSTPKSVRQEWAWNPPEFFPPTDCKEYEKWRKDESGRYHTWATGPEMKMTNEQGVWPYYWDTYIKANILNVCFIPLAENLSRLEKYLNENNEDAILTELKAIRINLLKYEDVKSMYIHQSGPVADILSSYQLGTMLGAEGFGVHARKGVKKYAPSSPEEIEVKINKELDKYREEWKFTDSQVKILTPLVREYEAKKWDYSNETGKWMRKVQQLLSEGKNNNELFDAARLLFYSHKLFVYWLSDFNTPKWNLWLNIVKAPPSSVAREFINAREDQYDLKKLDKDLSDIKAYYWYPPILYVNPVDPNIFPNGFGSRSWPFKNVQEAVAVAKDGTEIRVVGSFDKTSIDLSGKKLVISDGFNGTFNAKSTN
jgi:hypothetical protein